MFLTAPGVSIPFPERIKEEYAVYEGFSVRANISFEHLGAVVNAVVELLPEPLFLVIELPLTETEEQTLSRDGTLHREVLYLDGQSRAQIAEILSSVGQTLLCDGMSQFAVASHSNRDEIFVQKYKLVDIFSETPERFVPLLQSFGLRETKSLTTVWDTFSPDFPGKLQLINLEGLTVHRIVEELKKRGMYRAKIVSDD